MVEYISFSCMLLLTAVVGLQRVGAVLQQPQHALLVPLLRRDTCARKLVTHTVHANAQRNVLYNNTETSIVITKII